MTNRAFINLSTLLLSTLLFLSACGTPGYKPKEENPPQEIPDTEPVAADGTLEAVTWNIEWYGSDNQGPDNEIQQTKNVLQVINSLKADLYAFQEISDQQSLDNLTEHITGYRGFVADYITYNQKLAFVYNTNTISVLSSGFINSSQIRNTYAGQWNYYWANGRMPFYVNFSYKISDSKSREFYVVIIHAKANTGDNDAEHKESYKRRQMAAEGLYYYLKDHKPNASIILLGDYNDDVDESIFYYNNDPNNTAETPYDEFVEDNSNFNVITKILSETGESASINYSDIIDHITMSNELFPFYKDQSAAVYYEAQENISNYENTTSDHLPVWVKFDLTVN